jgi:hypothetical protein
MSLAQKEIVAILQEACDEVRTREREIAARISILDTTSALRRADRD